MPNNIFLKDNILKKTLPGLPDIMRLPELDMKTCWFCKRQVDLGSDSYRIEVFVSKDISAQEIAIGVTETKFVSTKRVVSVPRCDSCAATHKMNDKLEGVGLAGCLISVVVLILAFLAFRSFGVRGTTLIIFSVLAAIIFFLVSAFGTSWLLTRKSHADTKSKDIKSRKDFEKFIKKAVKSSLAKYWGPNDPVKMVITKLS